LLFCRLKLGKSLPEGSQDGSSLGTLLAEGILLLEIFETIPVGRFDGLMLGKSLPVGRIDGSELGTALAVGDEEISNDDDSPKVAAGFEPWLGAAKRSTRTK